MATRNALLALVAAVAANTTAYAAEPTPALKAVIEAAKKEGTLNLSYPQSVIGGAAGVRQVESGINQMFGTSLRLTFAPAVSLVRQSQQLVIETSAGQKPHTDVYIGPPPSLLAPVERKVFAAVNWTELLPDRIRPEFVEGGGQLLRFAVTFPVIVYNTQRAPFVPKTLADMLRPEWKGKFATHRFAAGFELLPARDVWGAEKTLAFMRQWSTQAGGLIQCGAEVERVASGEYAAMATDCIGGNTISWQERGAPLEFVIPADAAQIHYYYLAVPARAQSPNAAKLFAVFMLSEAGQRLNYQTWKVDLDGLPGSRMGEVISRAKGQGTKFTEATMGWWVKHPEIHDMQDQLAKILQQR